MFSPPSSTLSMLSLDSSVHPSSSHKRKRSSDITNVSPSTSLAQQTAKDSGLIRCICGYVEDDGLTIFCDMCGFWQHMSCVLTPSPSSSSQQDNADTTTDDDEGDRSSSSARSSSSKGKSRPPVPALPEQWFCELCVPRPVDARSARARQTRRLQVDRDRELREAADVDVVGSRRRPRLEGDKRRKSSTHTAPSPTEPQKRSSKNGTTIHHRKTTTGASGSHSALSANGRRRSASVDVLLSPADEESLFEPWSNEYTRILHDFIADDAVRTSIRRWRTSLGCAAPSSYRDTASPAISPLTACAPLPSPPFSKTTSCKFRVQVKPVPPSDCLPLPLPSVSSFPPYSAPSYHDKTASSDPSYKSASYSRPPAYGLYTAPTSSSSASGTIPVGTLLTTYISHIIPVTAYTSAPLSQYSLLHLPKPHVRLIPPPLSLALDAREMGNDSRFIRNGCHPNAAIRPVLDDTSPYGVVWGVYATKDMAVKGEEIVLGWEWDRDSVVHRLSDLLEHGCEDLQDEYVTSSYQLAPAPSLMVQRYRSSSELM
ncbi:hypothetical protein BS47DRAFT_1397885 [Hydnum rufescens UP504]|uniref:Zinc finger PHD-type domain-containing protein n=1 Tax=Hydnum rufescens UP504 TaxID=1448309 RepID=A0A9P6AM03_9AGAM|nr:hypothetical protein BS47DRAFT_1397885 [Hydnum rufescens UP504]